jgi:DNA-binding NarL/FixJ family response regulator
VEAGVIGYAAKNSKSEAIAQAVIALFQYEIFFASHIFFISKSLEVSTS